MVMGMLQGVEHVDKVGLIEGILLLSSHDEIIHFLGRIKYHLLTGILSNAQQA